MSYDRFLKLKEAEATVVKTDKGKIKKRKIKRKYESARIKKYPVYVLTAKREFDFLKYWGIVEMWALDRYKLKRGVLFTLFGLYQEEVFSNKKFELYARALDRNYVRLIQWYIDEDLIKEVDISKPTEQARLSKTEKSLLGKYYKLTFKANIIVREVYRKLTLRSPLPEDMIVHNIDKKKGVTNKRDRIERMVKEFNAKQLLISEKKDESRIDDDYIFLKRTMLDDIKNSVGTIGMKKGEE